MAPVGVGINVILQGGIGDKKYPVNANKRIYRVSNKLYSNFSRAPVICLTYVNRTPIVSYF